MMQYKIEITARAEEEYQAAFWFLEQKQKGLEDKFESEANNLLNHIINRPQLFARKYKQYREALFKGFPYFIVYEIIHDTVIVHSFFHTSRNPRKKY